MGGVSFAKHDASARAQAITQLLYVTSFVFTLLTSLELLNRKVTQSSVHSQKLNEEFYVSGLYLPLTKGYVRVCLFCFMLYKNIVINTGTINTSASLRKSLV